MLGNNKKISPSNRKILHILQEGLQNLCQDDLDSLAQLRDVFNLVDLPPELIKSLEDYDNLVDHQGNGGVNRMREKRQLLIAAAVGIVSSLTTLFTSKELFGMSTGSSDEVIDDTNHIISTISHQESKLVRLETRQKQLNQHLDRLTDQLIRG